MHKKSSHQKGTKIPAKRPLKKGRRALAPNGAQLTKIFITQLPHN